MPDLSDARWYARTLAPPLGVLTIQTFADHGGAGPSIRAGTVGVLSPWLAERQAAGCGVFATVQATPHGQRKARDVTAIRAHFIELDGAAPPAAWHLPPSMVVQSRAGLHAYWLTTDAPLDGYAARQKRLAAMYGGDPVVHDLPRVLRVPGTIHQKGAPFAVGLLDCPGHRYPIASIMAGVPALPPPPPKPAPAVGTGCHAAIDGATVDAMTLFAGRGWYMRPAGQPGKHWVVCPWYGEHTGGVQGPTDAVLWLPDTPGRWPTFHCSHAHCHGRRFGDVLRLLDVADAIHCGAKVRGAAGLLARAARYEAA